MTMFMYLDEVPEGQTRDDLAMIIHEVLDAAYAKGVKNEKGIWITPAFPKLIYVLDEDNIDRGFQVLVSDGTGCTNVRQRRMVPDYISAKVMRELKSGECLSMYGMPFFPDGRRFGQRNPDGSHKYYGRFNQGVVTINLVDVALFIGGR